MKKNERISELVSVLGASGHEDLEPCYTGYFTTFNEGRYYEAHDVLEHLWLRCRDANRIFYQGLIQIAGAFVHLEKQFLRPEHPKDGKRLRPAVRLFRLGMEKIRPYGPVHLRLDVAALLELCAQQTREIEASAFGRNPWRPENAPRVNLLPA